MATSEAQEKLASSSLGRLRGERRMIDWFYRCLLCDAKVDPSHWESHLVDEHFLEYIRTPEPSTLMVDYVELSK